MGEYFKNKYRVDSTRLSDWDYDWSAVYFVTICTHEQICLLSGIKDDKVDLLRIGKIVKEELLNISKLRPYVLIGDFVIMPNHLHIILKISEDDFGRPHGRDTVNRVSTDRKFGSVPPKSLSSIINTFKGGVTRRCHKNNLDFSWQSNYYEHIIRDNEDLARIKQYIANNPLNWASSINNPKNFK